MFDFAFSSGILEVEDKPDDNPDDEILTELRKKQQELKALSEHNYVVTKRLFKMAKDEMTRQDLRKKMAAADAEVKKSLLVFLSRKYLVYR